MRKVLLILATMVAFSAMGQTVSLKKECKCDAMTQVALRKAQQTKKSGEEVRLIAKVGDKFDAKAFARQGITVGAKAGNIVTLRLSTDLLPVVENSAEVLQYTLSEPVFQTMDRTRTDTRTDSVQAGLGLPQAYTGKDVIIGITDWGFDYKHPNFNNNGQDNRRLLQAWDQFRLSGPAPEGFDYGTVFTNRHDLLQAEGDTAGLYGYATHGSHVAGIAAGRGVDGTYVGQAPYANLLFCSFHLDLASWMDGVQWMWNVAKAEGKRLVVNNSWGMYTLGPIDGTSLASQAINSWSDSGIVFVVSAGNCGNDNYHICKSFSPASADTLRSLAAYYGNHEIGQNITFWGEPGKAFKVSFAMVNGADSVCFDWLNTADGDRYIDTALTLGEQSFPFSLTMEQANIFNNRPHALLSVAKKAGWEIHVAVTAQEGLVHGWNLAKLANDAGNMGCAFTRGRSLNYTAGDSEFSIGEPACAEKCIAVAAHNADSKKPNGDVEPGRLASFSSHGPIIDGRQKPEISAPGTNVASSISSYTDELYTPVLSYSYGGRQYIWARMSGTSMSGPAVTGIVALILEANPNLSPDQVKEIICSTARNDEMTGPLHDRDSASKVWGWGKINALAAVNEALAHVDIQQADESWFGKSLQVYPNPAADQVTVLTGRHTPEQVELYSITGALVKRQQVTMEGTMDISALPHGVYIVKCGARNARLVH